MAYVVSADIEAEFKGGATFGASTAVTTTNITEFISQEEAVLNGKLAKRYAVPITGTEALKIAKRITTGLVKARILDILAVKTGDPKLDQSMGGGALRRAMNDLTDMIVEGKIKLTDGTPAESDEGVDDYISTDDDIEMKFDRETDQW